MKLLLFGARGQVGWELQRSLAPLGDLIALERASSDYCGDLTDLVGIANAVRAIKPDVIVNAAAYTAVDQAESDAGTAHTVNSLAPGVLAESARAIGALLVHYSTDYVFNGSGSQPWLESDGTGPLNVYGHTKLEGEQRVAAANARHLIFRSSWVYSVRGSNFIKTILQKATGRNGWQSDQQDCWQDQQQDTLAVVNDQFGAPTSAELLADVTAHAIRQVLQQPSDAGLYHVAAGGETTWFDYANHALAQLKRAQPAIKIIVKNIQPIASAEPATFAALPSVPSAAQRPKNSRLSTAKLQQAFGLRLPHWQVGVNRLLADIHLD